MMTDKNPLTSIPAWDDEPMSVAQDANFIWSIANKLRGSYMPDKYGDVIIPMTIIRRFECALEPTKEAVVKKYESNPAYPAQAMYRLSGYGFYNTSRFTLAELCNDAEHLVANFAAYIESFSANVVDILDQLQMLSHIEKMNKDGCLYSVVKAFSELDLSPETFDTVRMGYIFENLIGRFFQNVDAGQYYTGRDIIKLCVSLLLAEGCDDIFDDHKVITICDQACGTGGMLSTAYDYIHHFNATANIQLFGQEYNGVSYAVGLAEMLIKGQNADNFRHADTFKEDCFPDVHMRFMLENPPFGTPWAGKDAKDGQETSVRKEFEKGDRSRWGAGLPTGGDGQLLFLQSALAKLDPNCGRAAIIENGSPLFTGGTASGESQIRRYLLNNDRIEAIVQLPTDLFYNTGISTYIWILSMNKRPERKGKIQLIDASGISHKLRKSIGNKRNEFSAADRAEITRLYADFKESELSKIFPNTEFLYREYSVMQPLQRSYSVTAESIEALIQDGTLKNLWDETAVEELEAQGTTISAKDKKKLEAFKKTKALYDDILNTLRNNISAQKWLSIDTFLPILSDILANTATDKKLLEKIANGLSVMDKSAIVQRDRKGNIIYDKTTKDTEIIKWDEDIEDYMSREVLPHLPDAQWFWEENPSAKKPIIKSGAEIPFTRHFYQYQSLTPTEELEKRLVDIEKSVSRHITAIFNIR